MKFTMKVLISKTIFFILFVCVSCSRYYPVNMYCPNCDRKLKGHLKKISKINSNVDIKDWRIRYCYKDNYIKSIHYEIDKHIADTTYVFDFGYYPKTFYDKKTKTKYRIEEYKKSYYEDGYQHLMALFNNDTLYYYKREKSNYSRWDYDFIRGKYYFMNRTGCLSRKQAEYFRAHKDSLIKVRGNDLPRLPE